MLRFVLTVALLLLGPKSASLAADCPAADVKPRLEVVVDDGSIAYDFIHTRLQLSEIPRQLGVTAPNHGAEPQGLTVDTLSLALNAELRYRDIGRGNRCIYPGRIQLTVSSEQRVFVDMRYRDGSCERAAVLDHENGHVGINRAAARAHEDDLRRAVETFLAAHPFLLAPIKRPLQDAYLVPIRERVGPILNAIRHEAEIHHAALDSPASYAMTRERCRHW